MQPWSLGLPSRLQASRMACISPCQVGSLRAITWFQPSASTLPEASTTTAPNAPPDFSTTPARRALAIARRMKALCCSAGNRAKASAAEIVGLWLGSWLFRGPGMGF